MRLIDGAVIAEVAQPAASAAAARETGTAEADQ